MQAEIEAKRAEYNAKAQEIIKKMEGKERSDIKHKLIEAEIPLEIIDELLPSETGPADAGAAEKPK